MTDPLGQSQVLPYLLGITEANYHISLISFEKEEVYAQRKGHILKTIEGSNIDWLPQIYTKKPPVISTIKDIIKMARMSEEIIREKDIKLVHARSYISALVALRLKRKYKLKFVFDMRGFWADERVGGGIWNLDNPIYSRIYKFFKKKELEFFQKSDYTISLTHTGKKEIFSWQDLTPKPDIEVIPCCVDTQLFTENNVDDLYVQNLKGELNISPDSYVLGYVGAIGSWYLLPEMFAFFKLLCESEEKAIFLFITKEDPDIIWDSVAQAGVEKDRVRITSTNRENMPNYLSVIDASVFFLKPIFSEKARSPTKLGELMSMGIPVICNQGIGDTELIINKYDAGYVVKDFTINQYSSAIKTVLNQSTLDYSNMKKGATEYFSLKQGVDRYIDVYQKTLN